MGAPAKPVSTALLFDPEFYRRLETKLGAEGATLQDKVTALLEQYVDGPTGKPQDIPAAAHAALFRRHARARPMNEPRSNRLLPARITGALT
jgi:hypothetical protein